MKNINQIIKKMLLLIAVSAVINNAYADGIAGKDKYIPLQEGEPELVTLTASGGGSNCCYQWTAIDGEIVGEGDQQSIKIKPKSPKSTFRVERACASGTESDEVDVYYEDFSIVSITPLKKCYPAGDNISLEDFNILTSPQGYEKSVKTEPNSYPLNRNPYSTEGSYISSIKFYENYGVPSEYSVDVLVVNEGVSLSISAGHEDAELLKKQFENAFGKVKSAGDKIQKVNKLIPIGVGCSPEFKLDVKVGGSFSPACCNDNVINNLSVNISGSCSFGLDCKFPIPALSIAGKVGANVIFGASLSAEASRTFNLLKCKENGMLEFSITPRGEIYGGIEFIVVDEKYFGCSGKLIGYLQCSDLKVTLFPFSCGSFKTCIGLEAEFNAKVLSFIDVKKNITLAENCWWSN